MSAIIIPNTKPVYAIVKNPFYVAVAIRTFFITLLKSANSEVPAYKTTREYFFTVLLMIVSTAVSRKQSLSPGTCTAVESEPYV